MQGLGDIIRANATAGGLTGFVKRRNGGKFGVIGGDGQGTPWLAYKRRDLEHMLAPWAVKRVADGVILGEYVKQSLARKHIARLIMGTP